MSIKIMSEVWENGPEKQGEMVVLLVLADYANDDGECWPSVNSIAQKSRIEERSARRILRKLEKDGWIECKSQHGRNHTNLYQISRDALKPDNMSPRTIDAENRTISAENRTIDAENRTHVSPEPSRTIKNHQEPSKSNFDEFWNVCFHRNGLKQKKPQAERAFKAAVKGGADPGVIIASARAHAQTSKIEDQYKRGPLPWLNQRGWEDEGIGAAPPNASPELIQNMLNSPSPAVREAGRNLQEAQQ